MTYQTIEKDCPDYGVLVNFLRGKLVPPELEDCESHLEDCGDCQETLSGIDASDTLSDVVATAMDPSEPSTDDADVVQNLVRRLGKPADLVATQSTICSKELLRDRAAEVLLHVSPDTEYDQSLGLLAGFRLRELLGSGGTGVVFRAYDLALDREIALKVLRPSLGDLARDRFVAEARAAASIDHENVVAIYQVGEQDRLAWIAMKWVPGETLESRLLREGSLAEDEVRKLSIQIAKGLAEAHRQQLVHRDIKPANVWIGDADGRVLILDFGLVRITDNDPALTATGMLAGTPNFMSPEQAKGQELDSRSDLFSLGCVMYQMITGTLPFGSPTILATLQSIQTQQPEAPILFADDCSDELSDLTMALLEKEPADRVDSAESLVRCFKTPRSDWPANIKRCIAAKRELNESGKKLAAAQSGRSGAGAFIAAMMLGLFGFGLWLFAPQIIRITTDQGELVIETDGENVKVTVSQDGEEVRVLDTDSGASFDIHSGEFTISATGRDGKTEFQVRPNKLTMQRGGREVVRVTQKQTPLPKQLVSNTNELELPTLASRNSGSTEPVLYRGEPLSHWLKVLDTDLDAQTQAEGLRACAVIYSSASQQDEVMPLLQSYIRRNKGLFRGDQKTACFSGFEDALQKLSPQKITKFFKLQLKQGTPESIRWTYRGMTLSRDPVAALFSDKLQKELESNVTELLNLIAGRDDGEAVAYLLNFVTRRLLKDPASDEQLKSIETILTRLDAYDLVESANFVPQQLLTPTYFKPVMTKLLTAESSDKSDIMRLLLIKNLVKVENNSNGRASFLSEMLRTNASNFLRLTAKREKVDSLLLFDYIVDNLLSNPVSDDQIEAIREVLLRVSAKALFKAANKVPDRVLDEQLFASVRTRIFAADTKAEERDELIEGLIKIMKKAKGNAFFIFKTLAEVMANQTYASNKLKFGELQKMEVYAPELPNKDGKSYPATLIFIPEGYKKLEIKGSAVVARTILSELCMHLLDQDITSPAEIANKILLILAEASSSEKAVDPSKSDHFNQLRIDFDLEELKKFSNEKSGEFSDFIVGYRKFGTAPKVAAPSNLEKLTALTPSSKKDKNRKNSQRVFEGKLLSEWLSKLDIDRAPEVQAQALRACAALYASSETDNDFTAILEQYLKRNTFSEHLHQSKDQNVYFSGFADSLKTLPAAEVVELLKLQLKHGTDTMIDWTFAGMTIRRSSRSRLLPYSSDLGKELKANAVELLGLIAQRDDCNPSFPLFLFLTERSFKDPISDDAHAAITAVLLKLTSSRFFQSIEFVPQSLLTPKLFDPIKARLFARETTPAKRDDLIAGLIKVASGSGARNPFLLEIFAEVIANQMYASDKLEFDRLQQLDVLQPKKPSGDLYPSTAGDTRSIKIEGNDVVVRRLLTVICEKTLSAKPTETALLSQQAGKVLAAIIDPSSKESIVDFSGLRRHRALKIDMDIAELKKRSKGLAGKFSIFVYRQFSEEKRTFRVDPALVAANKTAKSTTSIVDLNDDRKATSTTDVQDLGRNKDKQSSASVNPEQALNQSENPVDFLRLIYNGKNLSEWLKVLENDQDPKTQAEAIKACGTLYESIGQNDSVVALLKSYLKRHATEEFIQDADQLAVFLGFGEVLEKLPPKIVVDFFKYELKYGSEVSIVWAYMGLVKPRDPRQISIFTKPQVYSPELDQELESNAIELLRLIAARENVNSFDYLLGFIVENFLNDPVSDDAIIAIKELVVKFEPKVLLKVVNKVPNRVLDEQLFASVRTRIFAADTKAAERDELIEGLMKIMKKAKGNAFFIFKTLAEVMANQSYASNKLKFGELQKMEVYAPELPNKDGKYYRATGFFIPEGYKKLEIKGSAVVARTILSKLCKRLLDKDITSPAEIAKKVLLILAEASSSEKAVDPSKSDHFNQLRIDFDLEELKKLSNKKSGEFSDFIYGKRRF